LYQLPPQLAKALVYLSYQEIKSIFDIGSLNGWTVLFIVSYLSRFNEEVSCISIDPVEGNLDLGVLDLVSKYGYSIDFKRETSFAHQGMQYDLCLIDGNHSYHWVTSDFYNVGYYSKFCWFHDIQDKYCVDVGKAYSEIRRFTKTSFEFTDGASLGIGILSGFTKVLL
jgi:hypothetical protein